MFKRDATSGCRDITAYVWQVFALDAVKKVQERNNLIEGTALAVRKVRELLDIFVQGNFFGNPEVIEHGPVKCIGPIIFDSVPFAQVCRITANHGLGPALPMFIKNKFLFHLALLLTQSG